MKKYYLGDVHGINSILPLLKDLEDCELICVGDLGLGFQSLVKDSVDLSNFNKILIDKNILFKSIRGNHDNPYYWNSNVFEFSNIYLIPDYTIIDTTLYVGGAYSIDRKIRTLNKSYWENEHFYLDEKFLKNVKDIDTIVTHTCPIFCFPTGFNDVVMFYAEKDKSLLNDLRKEREDMNTMYKILTKNNKIKNWYYGHFHISNSEIINKTKFTILTINEIK